MTKKRKINPKTDVIIKIDAGCVSDYYLPKGLQLIVIDIDSRIEEEYQDIIDAAEQFLDKQNEKQIKS